MLRISHGAASDATVPLTDLWCSRESGSVSSPGKSVNLAPGCTNGESPTYIIKSFFSLRFLAVCPYLSVCHLRSRHSRTSRKVLGSGPVCRGHLEIQ
jgi:hypothetical protein